MRNILQLLGGVAVAGAVAAGATAFTAPGVTDNTTLVLGGGISTDVAIVGASLDAVTIDSTDPGKYSDINVTISTNDSNNDPIITGTVKALVTGTTSNGAPVGGAYTSCTHTSGGVWNCPAGSGSEAWDTITGLKISVSNPGV